MQLIKGKIIKISGVVVTPAVPHQQKAAAFPGALNTGADLLSRGAPVYGELTLHLEIVEQIWARHGWVTVGRFTSRENAQCALFYSLNSMDALLSVDALAHIWPHKLLHAFSPLALIAPNSVQSKGTRPCTDFDSATSASYAVAGRGILVAVHSALAAPTVEGPAITWGSDALPPTPRTHGAVGLAPEWLNLSAVGLSLCVISTSARASSTRSLYDCKWRMFTFPFSVQ